MLGIRRREFMTLLCGAAAWPLAGRTQAIPVIGLLSTGSADGSAGFVVAFREGLKESGYAEGRNVAIEFRWAEGQFDRLPAMAADPVRSQVAVIAAISPYAALAAKMATETIPIVFQSGFDPVEFGLVSNLNRPGSNITGFYRFANELLPKSLELLHEVVPNVAAMALLVPSSPRAEGQSREAEAAARSIGLQQLHLLTARTECDVDVAFKNLVEKRDGALVIAQDPVFNNYIRQFAVLARYHGVPSIYSLPEFTAVGGLISYGASLRDQYRQVGVYVGRILKGEKAGDLPVQQATKIDLIINNKTAKSIGLEIPPKMLAIADKVIE
jgi:putative tryptophan/tyrosine transport system substrate-binding protein